MNKLVDILLVVNKLTAQKTPANPKNGAWLGQYKAVSDIMFFFFRKK